MKDALNMSVLNEQTVTREMIEKGIRIELINAVSLLDEILQNKDLQKVIVDYYYNRYLTMKDQQAAAPELPLKEKEVENA